MPEGGEAGGCTRGNAAGVHMATRRVYTWQRGRCTHGNAACVHVATGHVYTWQRGMCTPAKPLPLLGAPRTSSTLHTRLSLLSFCPFFNNKMGEILVGKWWTESRSFGKMLSGNS